MNLSKIYQSLSNQPRYRLDQIDRAIFQDFVDNWDDVTTLPKDLRQKLNQETSLEIDAQLFELSDETAKALITLEDGCQIETVLMSHEDARRTICVSSQVGCPLDCKFCATGHMGFTRNLTTSEIVEQVLFFARYLKDKNEKITNIVYMGMGEPFLNYDNVIESIKILNDPKKFGLGARHFSISTAGIVEGINKLVDLNIQVNLAISLHTSNNDLRSELMPINNQYPLEKVLTAVDNYIIKTSRQVMFEYLLIKGVNDSTEDAMELAKLMDKKLYIVNLIPCNPVGEFKAPSKKAIENFKNVLAYYHIPFTQRHAFGQEIEAACGQLAIKKKL
ncbi:MAG: 23S rRNA (adenine(2503)-C(2))-methyltransferase RlmN [Patescibacteria group bacterium]